MYPHDIPDEAHPVSGKSSQEMAHEFYVELDGQNEPLAMSPEWINSEALHAAVATAQMEVTGKGVVWGSEEILDLARIYGEFIRGER